MPYITITGFLMLTTFMIFNIGDGIRWPKEILCILGFVSIIWAGLRHGKHDRAGSFSTKWMWIFILWVIFDTFYLKNRHYASEHPITIEFLYSVGMRTAFYATLAAVTIQVLSTLESLIGSQRFVVAGFRWKPLDLDMERQVGCVLRFIAGMSVVMAGYVLFVQLPAMDQYVRVVNRFGLGEGVLAHRLVGTLGNPSVLSTWFAMTLPCVIYAKRPYGVAMVAACLYFQQGKGGIIAAAIALLFYLFFTHRKWFWSVLGLIVLSLFTYNLIYGDIYDKAVNYVSDSEGRFAVWQQAVKDWKPHTLTGKGFGSFEWLEAEKIRKDGIFTYNTLWKNPHNEYLRILYEVGIVGLYFYLMFCVSVLLAFLKSKKTKTTACLASIGIAFLINSLVLFPMEIATTAMLAVVSTGLLINMIRRKNEESLTGAISSAHSFAHSSPGLCCKG